MNISRKLNMVFHIKIKDSNHLICRADCTFNNGWVVGRKCILFNKKLQDQEDTMRCEECIKEFG